MADIEHKIRKFIVEKIMMKKDESLIAFDDSLLEQGIIDSWGIVELTNYMGREFGVSIDDTDIVPENFDTVASIAGLVRKNQ